MHNPETVSDFLVLIDNLRNDWAFADDDRYGPWFRGHEREDWQLSPNLYRNYGGYVAVKRGRLEDEIREEFIARAPIMCESLPAGDDNRAAWEWYFMMQHHKAPTRLLDWTECSLIALYFAVKDNPGYYNAAVWVLDPYQLNKSVAAIGKEEIIPPSASGVTPEDRERVDKWLPPRFKNMAGLPKQTIAIYPTHVARRIGTQRSCFTIHGTDEQALEKLESKRSRHLIKIMIPSFSVKNIRKQLESCGIDESTIFPDLDGVGRSIATSWRPASEKPPHQGVYTRLRPSKIHGVGVFAIKGIKKGTPLFNFDNDELVSLRDSSLPKAPEGIRKLYEDFAVFANGRCLCPPNFNRLTMSWYLNEPTGEKPNVLCDRVTYNFYAGRDIKAGEELTVKYDTYSDSTEAVLRKKSC